MADVGPNGTTSVLCWRAPAARVEAAARLLGVSRSTLFEKMRKLDIRSDV
jgi:transcriptional regulator of acetoin/glycerol metabolism